MALTQELNIGTVGSGLVIYAPDYVPVPHVIIGTNFEDAFSVASLDNLETRFTLEGALTCGFVWKEVEVTLTLNPGSPTWEFLNGIRQQEYAQTTTIAIPTLSVVVPSIKRIITFIDGAGKTVQVMPNGKKILDNGAFTFVFSRYVSVGA